MNDYITALEASLRSAAAREYPSQTSAGSTNNKQPTPAGGQPARDTARHRWWRSPLAIFAILLLGGGSTAAAVSILTQSSAPLSGPVPGVTARGPALTPPSQTLRSPLRALRLRYDIPLTPNLEPGYAGWCSYPIFSITGSVDDTGGGTCSPAAPPGAPVILGGGEPISNELPFARSTESRHRAGAQELNLIWLVVSARVASVRINPRQIVAARADPRLPTEWKAVVAFATFPPNQIRPTPLDRYGRALRSPASPLLNPASGSLAPVVTLTPGAFSPGPCAIDRVSLKSVIAQWEVVAKTAPSLGADVPSSTLSSCARSWFSIRGQTEAPSAAVLLNAQNPNRPAPPLPGISPTRTPGVFSEPSAEILARRVGRAWLVVQSKSTALGQRLLNSIRVRGASMNP
jgi:hypothetical protein